MMTTWDLPLHAADAISLKQSLDGCLAQAFSFGRCWRDGPKIEEPIGRNVIGELKLCIGVQF